MDVETIHELRAVRLGGLDANAQQIADVEELSVDPKGVPTLQPNTRWKTSFKSRPSLGDASETPAITYIACGPGSVELLLKGIVADIPSSLH